MSVNVETLSRKELEDLVISQSHSLRIRSAHITSLKKDVKNLEEQYDVVSNVLLAARNVLNSGLSVE